LFLALDGVTRVMLPPMVVEGGKKAGYREGSMFGIGCVLLACTLCYAIPRTSILGAIPLTGYLGGAVATHVRIGDPFLSRVFVPVDFGVFVWVGLVLRDRRLQAFILSRRWLARWMEPGPSLMFAFPIRIQQFTRRRSWKTLSPISPLMEIVAKRWNSVEFVSG
jgi:hypothetical protein